MTTAEKKIRKHFQFYGDVQGVGFRYEATMAARALGLTGWVRNEYDGSVTMELQGKEIEISKAIEMIGKSRYINISRTTETLIPLLDDEEDFVPDYW